MTLQSKLVLLSFAICLLLPLTRSTEVKYCDKSADYAVTVHDVEISPNPVARGKPATFNISAYTGESISGGNLNVKVFFYGVHVHTETQDFCKEVSCPVSAGHFVIADTQTLPAFTPPGSYTLTMTMEDEGHRKLTCFSFGFKIGFGSSGSLVSVS